jgi:hypothetical protein
METVHEWNEKIMLLIEKLKTHHPELLSFLDEIQMTIPDKENPEISIKALKEYYNSLMVMENLK